MYADLKTQLLKIKQLKLKLKKVLKFNLSIETSLKLLVTMCNFNKPSKFTD